jgi:glycosyltransferase involved in cell wall biosynthesis
MAIVGFFLSTIFKKPFTVNTHVSFYFNKSSIYSKVLVYILNRAKVVLVLTHESQKELQRIGIKNVIVYHQWIDTKLFNPKNRQYARKKYSIPEKSFVVMFAGRFIKAKGIELILRAAKIIKKDILFSIVGSGELKETIEQEASKNPSLFFLGRVERNELPILYSAADICIFPSIQATATYAEGIPRVMIEALTCGTPLIATKTGGVSEVINNKIGFFVKPNVKEIVQLVTKLSIQKKFLESMRNICIRYANKEFGKEKNYKIIENSLL